LAAVCTFHLLPPLLPERRLEALHFINLHIL
jgi:hypothetical protein